MILSLSIPAAWDGPGLRFLDVKRQSTGKAFHFLVKDWARPASMQKQLWYHLFCPQLLDLNRVAAGAMPTFTATEAPTVNTL